jgi:ribosomal protein S12 methylthiotransferase
MLGRLRDRGYDLVADAHQADVIVVNTCAFIDRAKQESVDTILEMAKEKETGRAQRLVVTGCLSQRYDAELRREIPEIDATLGTGQVDDIVKAVEGDAAVDASEAPTWVYDHAARASSPRRPGSRTSRSAKAATTRAASASSRPSAGSTAAATSRTSWPRCAAWPRAG